MITLNRPWWYFLSPLGTNRLIVPPRPTGPASDAPHSANLRWDEGLALLSAALWRRWDRSHTPDKWYPLSFMAAEPWMSGCLCAPYLWEVKRQGRGFSSSGVCKRTHSKGEKKGKWLKKKKKREKRKTLQHHVFNLRLQGLYQSDATHYWWNVRKSRFFPPKN